MTTTAPTISQSGAFQARAGSAVQIVVSVSDAAKRPVDLTGYKVFFSFYDRETKEELLGGWAIGESLVARLPVITGAELFELYDQSSRLRTNLLIGYYVKGGFVELSEGPATFLPAPRTLVADAIAAPDIAEAAISLGTAPAQIVMRGSPGLTPWQVAGMTFADWDADLRDPVIAATEDAQGATEAALQATGETIAAAEFALEQGDAAREVVEREAVNVQLASDAAAFAQADRQVTEAKTAEAEAHANSAAAFAGSAYGLSRTFDTTEVGLAATSLGDYFGVPTAGGILAYRNAGGAAEDTGFRLPLVTASMILSALGMDLSGAGTDDDSQIAMAFRFLNGRTPLYINADGTAFLNPSAAMLAMLKANILALDPDGRPTLASGFSVGSGPIDDDTQVVLAAQFANGLTSFYLKADGTGFLRADEAMLADLRARLSPSMPLSARLAPRALFAGRQPVAGVRLGPKLDRWTSDIDGQLRDYFVRTDRAPGAAVPDLARHGASCDVFFGQSTCVGGFGGSPAFATAEEALVTPAAPFSRLAFMTDFVNAGTDTLDGMRIDPARAIDPAAISDLLPARECFIADGDGDSSFRGETGVAAMLAHLCAHDEAAGAPVVRIGLTAGMSGKSLAALSEGTVPFENAVGAVGQVAAVLAHYGIPLTRVRMPFYQGQNDRKNPPTPDYDLALVALATRFDARVRQALAPIVQANRAIYDGVMLPPVQMLVTQLPGAQNAGFTGPGDIALAAWRASLRAPELVRIAQNPVERQGVDGYFVVGTTNAVHYTPRGYAVLGEGYACAAAMLEADATALCVPQPAPIGAGGSAVQMSDGSPAGRVDVTRSGATITINFAGPGDLVFDTAELPPALAHGFRWTPATGTGAIAGVAITGPRQVTITLTDANSGGVLDLAMRVEPTAAAWNSRPCAWTNLRAGGGRRSRYIADHATPQVPPAGVSTTGKPLAPYAAAFAVTLA